MPTPFVLFSVDGMRPDGLEQANTPCMDRLIANGSSTLKAQTVMPSVTLPCHTSMHRGVDVSRHGVTTNSFQPLARPVPGIFDVARSNGLDTAMFYNWSELRDLMDPGSIYVSYIYNIQGEGSDEVVAKAAVEHLKAETFDLTFVYLGYTDTSGHEYGWMTPEYIKAIEGADACIQQVLDAFQVEPNLLVVSDHGGHGRTHGTEMPEDMTIPFILHGPSIKSGFEITEPVRIFDTCTTIAELLGLPKDVRWDGRVVSEAFKE